MIDLDFDRVHLWHPYTSISSPLPVYPVRKTRGCRIILEGGEELVDGMASWWCCVHGYNHPRLLDAIRDQAGKMVHVMFGGLTHRPAVELGRKLVELTPAPLEKVFFADSGSVSVEVALKMALQYWHAQGRSEKKRIMTVRGGYHGDTFGAMSVCDPVTGMHSMFTGTLAQQVFVERPGCAFHEPWKEEYAEGAARALEQHSNSIAAVIIEPIVQGAGGMWFYSPDYLARLRDLCDEHDVLLIADEIATGFGRTGRMFACEHAGISPDILCVGKALTGGTMSLAAALCTTKVEQGISSDGKGVLMHGPTFMANPLACRVALESVELLLESPWRKRVAQIEAGLREGLGSLAEHPKTRDVRVLGCIGVVEMKNPVDVAQAQRFFVSRGVWIRPFGKLVYLMPPYVISEGELENLTRAIVEFVENGPSD